MSVVSHSRSCSLTRRCFIGRSLDSKQLNPLLAHNADLYRAWESQICAEWEALWAQRTQTAGDVDAKTRIEMARRRDRQR